MPWPTTNGLRNLVGAEADLVRGAIGMMVDTHVAQIRDDAEPWIYGIDWFDQWDVGQRLWLLEKVTLALFAEETIEPSAAIFDAAVDAVFYEVCDLIQIEIERVEIKQGSASDSTRSWRQSVVDAYECQNGRRPDIGAESIDFDPWRKTITQVADSILGVRLYQRAEHFRDVDYKRTQSFLRDRGLSEDYLTRIPPLRSIAQTQRSIDRIQACVFQ